MHPVTDWSERDERIAKVQGNHNPYVQREARRERAKSHTSGFFEQNSTHRVQPRGRRRGFLTMRIPRIYHPEPLDQPFSHRALRRCRQQIIIGRVLRMGPGQALQLFDGSNPWP